MPKVLNKKRGEFVSRSFVCPAGILRDCEVDIVRRVRVATGWKANRSRLLQALLDLAARSAGSFDADEVCDQASFVEALRKSICSGNAKAARRK